MNKIYNISGKKNIKRYKLSEEEFKELIDILNTDFCNYSQGSFRTDDGSTYGMTYYNEEGTVVHNYRGDIGDVEKSDTLSKILKIINR